MYENEVRKMLDYMNKTYDFEKILPQITYCTVDDFCYETSDDDEYQVRCGATRLAVLDDMNGLVYKFDYTNKKYCEREYENWLAAQAEGVSDWFIGIEKVEVRKDFVVYVQDMVLIDEDENMSYISDGVDFDDPDNFYADSCDLVRERLPMDVVKFLDKHDINDLHEGNITVAHGSIEIFDYAGYDVL